MDDCDVELEQGPVKQRPRLSEMDEQSDLYRVSPFSVCSFSGHALSVIPSRPVPIVIDPNLALVCRRFQRWASTILTSFCNRLRQRPRLR
jgi:hypothetical protein